MQPKHKHIEPVGKISKILLCWIFGVLIDWFAVLFCFVLFFLAELSDGRKIHIINIEDVFYLSGIEMAKMIPRFQQESDMDAELVLLNCTVNRSVIKVRTYPNVFMGLAT